MDRPLIRGLPPLLIVAAVATRAAPAALSVLLLGDGRALLTPDSLQYLELASSLAWSGSFVREGFPEIFRTPLFPLLVVPGTWLGAPVLVTICLQVLLSVIVTALVFDAARLLTGSTRAATAAAVVYLLEPGQPIWSSLILADALLTAIAALLVWLVVRYRPSGETRWRDLLVLAGVAAAAAYAKPPGYFFGIIVAAGIAAAWSTRAPGRVVASHVALLLVVNTLALLPWHIRNYAAAGYGGFSTQFERAAFISAPAAIEAARTGKSFAEMRGKTRIVWGGDPEAESVRESRRSGLPRLRDALPAYAWMHVKGSALVLMGPGLYWWDLILGWEIEPTSIGSTFQAAGGLASLERLRTAGLWQIAVRCLLSLWPLCCVVLWVVAAWRGRAGPAIRVLGVIVVLWLLISGGPHADNRLRSPVVPALSVLAGVGWLHLRQRGVAPA